MKSVPAHLLSAGLIEKQVKTSTAFTFEQRPMLKNVFALNLAVLTTNYVNLLITANLWQQIYHNFVLPEKHEK
jgi:hypothetical protein